MICLGRALLLLSLVSSSQLKGLPFYGDIRLEQYLREICSVKADIVLISGAGQGSSRLTVSCPHSHFSDRHPFDALSITLNKRMFSQTLLLDLTHRQFSPFTFKAALRQLSGLYLSCRWCRTCLVMFNESLSTLQRWSTLALHSLPLEFRAAIVSATAHQVIHIRPVLHGCLIYPGIFLPQSKHDFALLKMSSQQCNLNATTINVSLMNVMPFCRFSQSNGTIVSHFSTEIELLKLFQQKYNFHVNFIDGKKDYGNLVNGSWNGMIGNLLNRTSDISMCNVGFSFSQGQDVDFSAAIVYDDITFMTHSPGLVKMHSWLAVSTFQRSTWMVIIGALVVISFLMFAIHRSHKRSSLVHIFLKLLAICFKQSNSLIWRDSSHSSGRLLYAFWMVAALLLTNFYGSHFYSILTVSEYGAPLDTVDDLVHLAVNDLKYLITYSKSVTLHKFIHAQADNRVHHLIGLHMNRTMQAKLSQLNADLFLPLTERDSQYVIIGYRLILADYRYRTAQKALHLASESLEQNYFGLIFRKKSPLRYPFNIIIKRAHERGLIVKWIVDTLQRYQPSNYMHLKPSELLKNPAARAHQTNTFSNLHIRELISVFTIWSTGLICSVVCFFIELTTLWLPFTGASKCAIIS